MRHLYWALFEVTCFGRLDITNEDRPSGWRAWIAGVAVADGLVCWLLAVILFNLFKVHLVGAIISAVAICLWQNFLRKGKLSNGMTLLIRLLMRLSGVDETDQAWMVVARLLAMVLKPVLLIALIGMRRAGWLIPIAVLSMCVMLDMGGAVLKRRQTHSWKAVAHWIVAVVVCILLGILGGVRFTMVSCVAIAAAFLLPPTVMRFSPFGEYDRQPLAKSLYLAFGELVMLLVGILGFALR